MISSCLDLTGKSIYTIYILFLLIGIQNARCETSSDPSSSGIWISYLDAAKYMMEKARTLYFATPTITEPNPTDCADVYQEGYKLSGVYTIWPRNRVLKGKPIKVFCDMDTDEGRWTVIQRRGNYSRPFNYFFKPWKNYKDGFGDLLQDFWLGNDNIFALTNQRLNTVRFEFMDIKGNTAFALYDEFWIDDENNKYKLHIQEYSGDAGDPISALNNQLFSTHDRDNDNEKLKNCANEHKGGWWYNACHNCNLNGLLLKGKNSSHTNGIIWPTWRGPTESLYSTEIKIRPKNFRIDFNLENLRNHS